MTQQTLIDYVGGTSGASIPGVTIVGTSTAVYDNAFHAGSALVCGHYTVASGNTTFAAITRTPNVSSPTTVTAYSIAMECASIPASALRTFAAPRSTAGYYFSLGLLSTGKVSIINSNGGTTIYSTLVPLVVGGSYSFEILMDVTTSGSNTISMNTYDSTGNLIDSSPKFTSLTLGQTGVNAGPVDVGVITNATSTAFDVRILNVRADNGATTEIGPIWGYVTPTILASTVPPANTNGTVATVANSGFDGVNVDTNRFTIDTAGGLQALDFNPVTNAIYGEWVGSFGVPSDYYWAIDLYYTATNTTSSKQIVRGLTTAAQNWALALSSQTLSTTPARLTLRNSSAAGNTAVLTSPAAAASEAPLNQWMRIEGHMVAAGAASTLQIRLYQNSGDLLLTWDSGPVTLTAGTSDNHFRVGTLDTPGGVNAFMRNVRTGTGGWLGPAASGSPATASGSLTLGGSVTAVGDTQGAAGSLTLIGVATGPGVSTNASITLGGTVSAGAALASGISGSLTLSGSATRLTPIARWMALPLNMRNIAHRGGDSDYPEMTRYAYQQCVADGLTAFNIDVVYTSDGVPVASHDLTSNRVFSQTGVTFSAVTWASISSYTTINGGLPIERADSLMDYIISICPNAVFFVENKVGGSVRTAFNTMLAARDDAVGRIIYKAYYQDTGLASCLAAGGCGSGWGYWFAADSAAITSANTLPWPILGEDYTGSSTDWTTMLGFGTAQGKLVFGHVIATVANATTAWGLGAQGLMTGKIIGVQPGADTASGSITLGGSVVASGVAPATASGSITLGGAVTAKAPATASGAITLGGAVTATAAATASGSLTLNGTATAGGVATASGSITLSATAIAKAAATASGAIALGGSVTAAGIAAAIASGSITLGGSVAAGAAVPSIAGSITLGGTAQASAAVFPTSSTNGNATGTTITVTLPTGYVTGSAILLIVSRTQTETSPFTFSSAVTGIQELANVGNRRLIAMLVTPNGTGQASFTLTSVTTATWEWWCADYRGYNLSATVDAVTSAQGSVTTSPVTVPVLPLDYVATGNELFISAAGVNATATWAPDANTVFNTTAGNAAMMVDATRPVTGAITAVSPSLDRGLAGTARNQNSLAFSLQASPIGKINLLSNGSFEAGGTLATNWQDEHTTVNAPVYSLVTSPLTDGAKAQQMVMIGAAGDNGTTAKGEIFQAPVAGMVPGDLVTFSVWLSGTMTNVYAIIGVEAFDSGNVFISETDANVLTLTGTPTLYSVSYVCPPLTDHVAVFLQFPGVAPTSSATVVIDKAILLNMGGTASGSITLGGSVAISSGTSANGSIALGGSATATAPDSANGSLALTAAASAAGTGTGINGSLTLSGSASAGGGGSASAAGSLTLGGSVVVKAAASAAGSITLSASALVSAPATAAGSITLNGAVAAGGSIAATASGSITLGASAVAAAVTTAAGSITLGGTTTAQAAGTANGSITLGASAAAIPAGGAVGQLTLLMAATAAGIQAANAGGSLALSGVVLAAAKATGISGSIALTLLALVSAAAHPNGSITLGGSAFALGFQGLPPGPPESLLMPANPPGSVVYGSGYTDTLTYETKAVDSVTGPGATSTNLNINTSYDSEDI